MTYQQALHRYRGAWTAQHGETPPPVSNEVEAIRSEDGWLLVGFPDIANPSGRSLASVTKRGVVLFGSDDNG